jgi:hypothetical protein
MKIAEEILFVMAIHLELTGITLMKYNENRLFKRFKKSIHKTSFYYEDDGLKGLSISGQDFWQYFILNATISRN